MWTSSRRWSTSRTRTSRSWMGMAWRRRSASEAAQGTVVGLLADGADHHPGDRAHALGTPHERPPAAPDARADLRRHDVRLSHRLYADGDGGLVRLGGVPE